MTGDSLEPVLDDYAKLVRIGESLSRLGISSGLVLFVISLTSPVGDPVSEHTFLMVVLILSFFPKLRAFVLRDLKESIKYVDDTIRSSSLDDESEFEGSKRSYIVKTGILIVVTVISHIGAIGILLGHIDVTLNYPSLVSPYFEEGILIGAYLLALGTGVSLVGIFGYIYYELLDIISTVLSETQKRSSSDE